MDNTGIDAFAGRKKWKTRERFSLNPGIYLYGDRKPIKNSPVPNGAPTMETLQSCPSADEMAQLIADNTTNDETSQFLGHIDSCTACQERLEEWVYSKEEWNEYQRTLAALHADRLQANAGESAIYAETSENLATVINRLSSLGPGSDRPDPSS